MSLVISVRDDDVVIEIAGVVDVGVSPALRSVLDDAIDAGFSRLVIDVTEVSMLAADAIGVFVAARRRLDALDGSLRVIGAQGLVHTAFEVTGLGDLLDASTVVEDPARTGASAED